METRWEWFALYTTKPETPCCHYWQACKVLLKQPKRKIIAGSAASVFKFLVSEMKDLKVHFWSSVWANMAPNPVKGGGV